MEVSKARIFPNTSRQITREPFRIEYTPKNPEACIRGRSKPCQYTPLDKGPGDSQSRDGRGE